MAKRLPLTRNSSVHAALLTDSSAARLQRYSRHRQNPHALSDCTDHIECVAPGGDGK
nr:hypothetical protein [uncultured Halomonas sp.]